MLLRLSEYKKSKIEIAADHKSLPDYSFQRVGMDYFEWFGKLFLILIDAYSHWFNIYPVTSTDFSSLNPILISHFTEHGIPEEIISDNGPPFQSYRFRVICEDRGIKHSTSSPNYPRPCRKGSSNSKRNDNEMQSNKHTPR